MWAPALLPAAALLLALAIDHRFGEPSNRWHPVAWFGALALRVGRPLPSLPPALALAGGTLGWALLVGGVAAIAWAIERSVLQSPAWAALPLLALALKPAFAWRMLHDEVAAVDAALGQGLEAGRERVSRLCSRDTADLDAETVRETAIETLAENLNDSLVAPLWWFVVLGLPGAWAFRAINTLDACWGYRGRWTWAGRCAARADDLAAWLPARLTAALLWVPGAFGLRRLAAEARRTPSPNGGWPMGAMALRLGVRLRKPGLYALNGGAPSPQAAAVQQALAIGGQGAHRAMALAVLALALRAALLTAAAGSVATGEPGAIG